MIESCGMIEAIADGSPSPRMDRNTAET